MNKVIIEECEDHGIKYNDSQDIIKQKILINKIYAEIARLQIVCYNNSIQLQQYTIDISRKRIQLIGKLNTVYERQLTEFTEARQAECQVIINEIDDLSNPNPKCDKLAKACQLAEQNINELSGKVLFMEQQLPTEKVIVNYKIKDKDIGDKCNDGTLE